MNRGNFLKSLLGIGAAAVTLPLPIKVEIKDVELKSPDIVDTINKLNHKMYKAFINNDTSFVTENDYIKVCNAYDEYCSIVLKEDGYGSDVILERAAFAKIKYHLLNKNVKYADDSFRKYKGTLRTWWNDSNGKYNYADACKEYANHLLYAGYIVKAKTNIEHFKMFCNPYALQKMQDKKMWNSVAIDAYNGEYKFRDNLCSNISYC